MKTCKRMIGRKECDTQLVRKVQHPRNVSVVPLRVFCYNSIITNLQQLVSHPNFLNMCDHWKNRVCDCNMLGDIYDGRIWEEFQYVDGHPFLASSYGIGLCMNIDWFQPFERTTESIGAIYLTVLNLPREERYKQKTSYSVKSYQDHMSLKKWSTLISPH